MRAVVIGAGLAGCEAAWQLAQRGTRVTLYEMKPHRKTPAHKSSLFGELVCSNSLRSDDIANAVGLLKEEMRRLGSLVIMAADQNRLPAGSALAVDREGFAQTLTDAVTSHPNITVQARHVEEIPKDIPVIVAAGPLATPELCQSIKNLIGGQELWFYDAAAPIVEFDSIDMDSAYFASRYNKGTPDYINCPMTEDEYNAFYDALISAEQAPIKDFESLKTFEGCMAVEVMAARGRKTLLFGPLKPVGLRDPRRPDDVPYAVVQLRRDNKEGRLYNMVGFQTHLKFPEQKRVFSMIPALKEARFTRFGVMHRNTYIDSPRLLDSSFQLKSHPGIFFAGQITGVEGYVESAASGLLAGVNLSRILAGKEPLPLSRRTAIGALSHYISDGSVCDFQPMNINFGIIEPPTVKIRAKREKNEWLSNRALLELDEVLNAFGEGRGEV